MDRRRLLLVAAVLIVVGPLLVLGGSHGRALLADVVAWLRAAGGLGLVAFAGAYVLAVVALAPGVWGAVLAGYLYGPIAGVLLAWPAMSLGAMLAFLLGRTGLRRPAARWLARRPRLAALDHAIGEGGARLVFLLRLCTPHNFLNYALAATGVSTRGYALGTIAGTLPLVAAGAWGGSLAQTASDVLGGRGGTTTTSVALLVAGALAAVIAIAWMTLAARRALLRATAPAVASAMADEPR